MPTLDVSDGFDPSFFDYVLVVHRRDDPNQYGRTRRTIMSVDGPVDAVVESRSRQITRDEDYSAGESTILVSAFYRLSGPAPDCQPDVVVLDASNDGRETFRERYLADPTAFDHYVVTNPGDFSRYGRGFTSATCNLTESVPQPPTPETV